MLQGSIADVQLHGLGPGMQWLLHALAYTAVTSCNAACIAQYLNASCTLEILSLL